MKTFKSIESVEQVRDDPIHDTVMQLVGEAIADCPDYRPEDDGYLVLIERGDVDCVIAPCVA